MKETIPKKTVKNHYIFMHFSQMICILIQETESRYKSINNVICKNVNTRRLIQFLWPWENAPWNVTSHSIHYDVRSIWWLVLRGVNSSWSQVVVVQFIVVITFVKVMTINVLIFCKCNNIFLQKSQTMIIKNSLSDWDPDIFEIIFYKSISPSNALV